MVLQSPRDEETRQSEPIILNQNSFREIRNWMYRNARNLDLMRFQYHFEQGSTLAVVAALFPYQNDDGGFGHGIEADNWNPNSTPIGCSTAITLLSETNFIDKNHPLVQGILRYLASGADFVNNRWLTTVPSNLDCPHAPWWQPDSISTSHSEQNPSAILAGFILNHADPGSSLYQLGLKITHELVDSFILDPELEMHPLLCLVFLLQAIGRAQLGDRFDLKHLQNLANNRISDLIQRDANRWDGYSFRPSEVIMHPSNPLYPENKALLEQEMAYILSKRNTEGIWDITWQWDDFAKAFAISENWWKANLVIRNLLLLKNFGRIG